MHRKYIILIIVLGLLAYGNSLFNSFVSDDEFVIKNNVFIKSFKNFPRLFNRSYLSKSNDVFFQSHRPLDIGAGELSYRPISTMTHFFEYAFWKLNPFGYHLDNLIIHLACAILLYIFVFLTLNDATVALWSGIIFVTHPINAETINIVSFREDILVGLFILLSFIMFILHKKYSYFKKIGFYFLSLLSFALAIFSKEMAISLPALIILYDFYFEYKGKLSSIFINIKGRYLGFLAVAAVYLYLNFVFFANPQGGGAHGYIGGSFYVNMLTTANAFSEYITSFWLPLNIKILPVYYAPVTKTFFNRETVLAVCLILAFIILALKSYKKSKAISFFIFWFFITLLPVSNIIPLVNPMAYRYVYLPIMGFCVLLAIIFKQMKEWKFLAKLTPSGYRILQASIIGLLIVISVPMNFFHKNRFTLAMETVRNFPNDSQSLGDLSMEAYKRGDPIKAIIYLKLSTRYEPLNPLHHLNLGVCYSNLGRDSEAIEEFSRAVALKPDYVTGYYNLAAVYMKQEEFDKAISYFKKAQALDPGFVNTYKFIADAYLRQKKNKLAIAELKKGLEIFPDDQALKDLLLKTEKKKNRL